MRSSLETPRNAQSHSDSELTLVHLWKIVSDRRRHVIAAMLLTIGAAIAIAVFATRKYEAVGEIQIQKDSDDALGLSSMIGSSAGAGVGDALDANITLQTQVKILQSQTLALTVIEKLNLQNTPDFQPKFSLMGWATGWMTPKGPGDPKNGGITDSPNKRSRLLRTFQSNTKVTLVPGTRLIDIVYTNPDPKLAAAIVNGLIESLTDYNFQTRYQATTQTSQWLGKQLSELRTSSDGLQKQVADLQRSSEVFSFGGQDIASKGMVYSTVLDQLQQTTVTLTQAQSNRILRGAVYQAAKSGNPEALASMASAGLMSGSSPAVGQSLALLQSLRAQEASQKALIGETSAKFGPAYTKLEEMKANLASVEQSIAEERGRLNDQAAADYEVAKQVEDSTRKIFADQKQSAGAMNDKAIQYQLLRQEADQSRELYSRLQSRLSEAGVLEGLKSSNITVVEPGRVPALPSSPNVMMLLVGGVILGLFLGIGYAFGKEVTDSTVRSTEVLSATYGDSFFGELPFDTSNPKGVLSKGRRACDTIPTLSRPQSAYSESLRSLRTALLMRVSGKHSHVMLVTSPLPQDGKSTTSVNLSIQLSQQGRRVLLVDADLRRPTLHKILGQQPPAGLGNWLENGDENTPIEPQQVTDVPGLFFITAGKNVERPAELLGSEKMRRQVARWREEFDCVVIDTSPLLAVTDGVLLAPMTDQVLVVARYAVTESTDLRRTYRLLHLRAPQTPVAVVMNGVKHTRNNAYYYSYASIDQISTPIQKGKSLHA